MYFESIDLAKRVEMFGIFVQKELPDIIALQELTGPMLRLLRPYVEKQYHIFTANTFDKVDYCTAILVKSEIQAVALPFFLFPNTSQKRGIQVVKLNHMYIATTHLESGEKMAPVRHEQFQQCFAFLSFAKQCIFMGDMNLWENEDIKIRGWQESSTADTYGNKYAKNLCRGRPDRVYIKGGSAKVQVLSTLHVSDHFGLSGEVTFAPLRLQRFAYRNPHYCDWKEFKLRLRLYLDDIKFS